MNRIPVYYPLQWPANKPRTPDYDRRFGKYTKKSDRGYRLRDITLAEAQTRAWDALDKFNNQGRGYVVSIDDCGYGKLARHTRL